MFLRASVPDSNPDFALLLDFSASLIPNINQIRLNAGQVDCVKSDIIKPNILKQIIIESYYQTELYCIITL